jgi:hypothetical protein
LSFKCVKYRLRSLRCYLRCARVLSLEPVGVKVTIRPVLQLRSKVTRRPNMRSLGAIRRSSIAGMVQRLASSQVTRAGCLGSSWRQPASPRRGSLGPGGVALRASTPATPSCVTCFLTLPDCSAGRRRWPARRRECAVPGPARDQLEELSQCSSPGSVPLG